MTAKEPAVYIMASRRNGALYTGVTSNLPQRTWQHREGVGDGFTRRYGCKALVWFEMAATMDAAIQREKQIKGGFRSKKLAFNPGWKDCMRISRMGDARLDCFAALAMTGVLR